MCASTARINVQKDYERNRKARKNKVNQDSNSN